METVESNNARLTGRVELSEPAQVNGCTLCGAPGHDSSSHSEQKNGTNKPHRENRETVNIGRTGPGAGLSQRKMRLALARQAIADLETETDGNRRLELMRLVEKLTSGRKPGKKHKARTDQSIFAR